jgi:hypothetical protein
MWKADSAQQRISDLRTGGYRGIDGVFVDTAVDVAIRRADARHREGHDAYRAGDGLGGRFSRREMIQAQADDRWGSVNRANFERVKDSFDTWTRYDNSVAAVLVASSAWPRKPGTRREDL